MKWLIALAMMAVLAFAGVEAANNPILAASEAENVQTPKQECFGLSVRSAVGSAVSNSEKACVRMSESISNRNPPVFAVTCGSDQWCCKHDIGGTGECTSCCAK